MNMRRSRRQSSSLQPGMALNPLVRLWMLRLLMPLGCHQRFIKGSYFADEQIAVALGLGNWIDREGEGFKTPQIMAALRKLHKEAETQREHCVAPRFLKDNVERLSKLVGLSELDSRILEFVTLMHCDRLLNETSDYLSGISSNYVCHVLSVLLDATDKEIRTALGPQSLLARSGLVTLDRNGMHSLSSKLEPLSSNFADCILSSDADPVRLLRGTVEPGVSAELSLSDYGHIDEMLAILLPYLKKSIGDGRKGVNVFLHGSPGTGKTQLVRVLSEHLGSELFEVASEDSDGDPISGEKRLRAYSAAQTFFGQRCALIVFDEVEDVFNDGSHLKGEKSTAQKRKAWINRMLEENPVPAFWLSNSIRHLDPAFVRRFDMVFELLIPPRKQRGEIIASACEGLLDSCSVARIADIETLAPAVVVKAASVVRSIRGELGEGKTAGALELLISKTLEAQGHRPIVKNDPNRLPETYDPAFIHADVDLQQVAKGLHKSGSGRLCLYGPPGTGKTAYGRWLAEQLGVPLLVKRASDLMSMWVGGTEKNIAAAFREAQKENAVLLIDEVDSFLQDRRGAQRSWEVSSVNEMLTQMESFAGVFIASTNLMSGLDQACLRRFDLKVKFDFLQPEQAWQLLCRHCDNLCLPIPAPDLRFRMTRLTKLTPGDYAAVARQQRFRPVTSAVDLISALEAECALKEGAKAAIGFV